MFPLLRADICLVSVPNREGRLQSSKAKNYTGGDLNAQRKSVPGDHLIPETMQTTWKLQRWEAAAYSHTHPTLQDRTLALVYAAHTMGTNIFDAGQVFKRAPVERATTGSKDSAIGSLSGNGYPELAMMFTLL
jgi:hypothetical protein